MIIDSGFAIRTASYQVGSKATDLSRGLVCVLDPCAVGQSARVSRRIDSLGPNSII